MKRIFIGILILCLFLTITVVYHIILLCTTVYTKMLSFFVVFWQNAQHIFGCAFGYRVV